MCPSNENVDLFQKYLEQGLALAKIEILPNEISDLVKHYSLLLAWNRKINLTGIVDPKEAATKHYIDSLALLPLIGNAQTLLDIGSGAGFPGLIMAACRKDMEVHLCESIGKKAHFLKEAKRALSLDNLYIHQKRVEELPADSVFDLVTGRAVAEPSTFEKLARNRVAKNGRIALFLVDSSLPLPGYFDPKEYKYTLPFTNEKRLVAEYLIKAE